MPSLTSVDDSQKEIGVLLDLILFVDWGSESSTMDKKEIELKSGRKRLGNDEEIIKKQKQPRHCCLLLAIEKRLVVAGFHSLFGLRE